MKLLYGLVVDGDGYLCVSVEGELHVVARPVLTRLIVTWQLQVLAASAGGGENRTRIRAWTKHYTTVV